MFLLLLPKGTPPKTQYEHLKQDVLAICRARDNRGSGYGTDICRIYLPYIDKEKMAH